MKITLSRIDFQEEQHRIWVTVSYSDEDEHETGPVNRVRAEIFLDWNDSYEEIKRQAFEKAKEFLSRALSVH